MRIKQLGNSGGLNFKEVSTSFLVEYIENFEKQYLLIDCGHKVLEEVSKITQLDKIKGVCITHTHFDHISELETLIYNRFFIHKESTPIITSKKVAKDLKKFLPNNKIYKDWKISKDKPKYSLFKINQINLNKKFTGLNSWFRFTDELYINSFKTFHPGIKSTGFILLNIKTKNYIIITGDTKSIEDIEIINANLVNYYDYKTMKIFHDYSNWDNPKDNIHACKSDINTYTKSFTDELTLVHDDTNFDNSWIKF